MGRKSRLKKERKETTLTVMPDGTKRYDLSDKGVAMIEKQLRLFKKTFGRDPEGSEPIFFDPEITDKPTPINTAKYEAAIVEALEKSNIDPAFIYAFKQTGLLVTQENEKLLTPADKQEWADAVKSYRLMESEM